MAGQKHPQNAPKTGLAAADTGPNRPCSESGPWNPSGQALMRAPVGS